MPHRSRHAATLVLLLLASTVAAETPKPDPKLNSPDPAKVEYFEKKVRPILVDHCYHCHSADTKPAGGLRVDDRNGLIIGGNNGPAVVPGNPDKSLLLKRSTQKDEKKRMPLEGKHLTEEQIEILETWIKDGAAWPVLRIPSNLGKPKAEYEALKNEHWAWQPLTKPKVPTVKETTWARSDVDRFLLTKLNEKGLKPVGDADRVTLIRRVTFDLTGLPPTPAEIDAFVKNKSPNAFEEVVDRLLASPTFGERWGRHWLDVARYGESTGPSRNIPYPNDGVASLVWNTRDQEVHRVDRAPAQPFRTLLRLLFFTLSARGRLRFRFDFLSVGDGFPPRIRRQDLLNGGVKFRALLARHFAVREDAFQRGNEELNRWQVLSAIRFEPGPQFANLLIGKNSVGGYALASRKKLGPDNGLELRLCERHAWLLGCHAVPLAGHEL